MHCFIFFFKQKTAYEMRISDWSSDVCSSDLKTVADYFQLRVVDLLSKRRTRSLARPRQIAMALAKELTEHSLPEIGDGFAGRDHTTVMHACKVMRELMQRDGKLREDWVERKSVV